MANLTHLQLHLRERTSVPTEYEDGLAPYLTFKSGINEKSPASARIRSLDRPARNLIPTLTTLLRLLLAAVKYS